jgi:hypothetical protein
MSCSFEELKGLGRNLVPAPLMQISPCHVRTENHTASLYPRETALVSQDWRSVVVEIYLSPFPENYR